MKRRPLIALISFVAIVAIAIVVLIVAKNPDRKSEEAETTVTPTDAVAMLTEEATIVPTAMNTPIPTETTVTSIPSPTNTPAPTDIPTPTPIPIATNTPAPAKAPTPTNTPVPKPTPIPTSQLEPTIISPTKAPTKEPTKVPTKTPTKEPTKAPTLKVNPNTWNPSNLPPGFSSEMEVVNYVANQLISKKVIPLLNNCNFDYTGYRLEATGNYIGGWIIYRCYISATWRKTSKATIEIMVPVDGGLYAELMNGHYACAYSGITTFNKGEKNGGEDGYMSASTLENYLKSVFP